MPDLLGRLASALGDRYRLERELGRGGMAVVYLAEDSKHRRRVALKVLRPELARAVGGERFLREIEMAAQLAHPNILPLYDSGEASEGLLYYVMPYVEGESLRQRLDRERQLPLGDALTVAREVADALAYAHARGVVHRDVKPENILLQAGHALVSDFGIARAVGEAAGARLTEPGLAVGTPAYMSPEQAAGESQLDASSDVYSLGCVLYEMLAGEPPYTGATPQVILARKATQPVPSVREVRETVPPAVERLVTRALAKVPADRFASGEALAAALDRAQNAARVSSARPRLLQRRSTPAVIALLAAALAAAAWWTAAAFSAGERGGNQRLAVLPFANIGGDSAQAYLADGIADELATALGKVQGIDVVSRTVTYRYGGRRDIDAREVGRQLGARYVVHGTVRRAAGKLHISAQLTHAAKNREVWSEDFERDTNDVFPLAVEITRAVAVALRGRSADVVPPGDPTPAAGRGTSDPDAFDLYLRGRYLLAHRGPGVRQAVERFEQAIAKDSSYARAYAGLSLALELLPYFEPVPARSVGERAIVAARHALSLDSTLSEAHTALGLAHQHLYEWERAGDAHRRAVTLDPTDTDASIQYGRYLMYTGRLLAARTEFERARRLDPYSAVASAYVALLLTLTGHGAEAVVEARRALELDSVNAPVIYMAIAAHLQAGRRADALALAARLRRTLPAWTGAVAFVYAELGDRATAVSILRQMEGQRLRTGATSIWTATAYTSLGDTARALDVLERATEARENWPSFLSLSAPMYDPLRRSARFAALVRRVGIDDRIFTSPRGGRPSG